MARSEEAEINPAAERPNPDLIQTLLQHQPQFLAFLEKRLGSRELAQDLLQDAFLRGLHKLATLRSAESLVAWFYRLLRNASIDQQRRRKLGERKLAAFGRELGTRVEPDLPSGGAACRCVAELAATLKPEYADALRAIEIDDLSIQALAQRAGISTNNAGVRVSRARKALRRQVIRCCGTCADNGCRSCTCGPRSSGKT
jgi:RNA polymerase sigma-70 factor (ECF subfamily)